MRLQRQNPKGIAWRGGRILFRISLRVLLILSLWHAPIPWVHAHPLAGPLVDEQFDLTQHVQRFHVAELHRGLESLDWHLHLILPWDSHSFPGDSRNESTVPPSDYLIDAEGCAPLCQTPCSSHAFDRHSVAEIDGWLCLYSLSQTAAFERSPHRHPGGGILAQPHRFGGAARSSLGVWLI